MSSLELAIASPSSRVAQKRLWKGHYIWLRGTPVTLLECGSIRDLVVNVAPGQIEGPGYEEIDDKPSTWQLSFKILFFCQTPPGVQSATRRYRQNGCAGTDGLGSAGLHP
jgi:hypothetical protein